MDGKQDYDVLGFIYEYLISNFAANAGKKAGEFYTPHEVSLLMSEIVADHLKDRTEIKIYDPTSGSGSLLINIGKCVARYMGSDNNIKYFAQELKENTYNLTRMNLVMRGILPDNIVTRNGDTLEEDWPFFDENDPVNTYNPLYVDAVVSNPPYCFQSLFHFSGNKRILGIVNEAHFLLILAQFIKQRFQFARNLSKTGFLTPKRDQML